mmetsp:Transcript_15748/g.23878  ORF Transcript_15748/g.23878 Transcript_15748/m.23878 type:complete len:255 (+) Transcript_15748:85-849(+)
MSSAKTVHQLKGELLKEQARLDDGGCRKENIMGILHRLDDVEMDLAILAETLIGKIVSKLKSCDDGDVASAARKLVKKWKRIVAKHQTRQDTSAVESVAVSKKASNDGKSNSKPGHLKRTNVVNVKVAHIRPQYENLEEWCNDPRNVYIGRRGIVFVNKERFPKKDSPFCNPFKINKTASREKVLAEYRRWVDQKLVEDERFRTRVRGLRGKNLGCWCHPEGCHGHILKEYADMDPDLFLATFGKCGDQKLAVK